MISTPFKLKTEKLSVARGDRRLFQDVDIVLTNGGFLQISGRNGVGKSTLLRMLCGLIRDFSGVVTLSIDSDTHDDVSNHAHYLGHKNALKPHLTALENLRFFSSFLDQPLLNAEDALKAVELPHVASLPVAVLSAGQKRRVAFARLLLNERPIWVLDEPTAALDKQSDTIIVDLISDHIMKGGAVVAATHLPLDVTGEKIETTRLELDRYQPENAFAGAVY